MADHKITNSGKTPIKVIDRLRGVHTVAPGGSVTVDLQAIYCDDKPARYSVEPVKD